LIYEVFSQPGVRDAIKTDPSKMSNAIEETLRLRPPFYGFFRRATKPMSVSGVEIPAASDVYVGWAAANRDPKMFDAPGEFRLDRAINRHLSFGAGIHTCPGAALARMEMRVLLEELLRRMPDLRVEVDSPVYQFGGGDYSFMATLPVAFTPGARERSIG
jgi:cytochrome P450